VVFVFAVAAACVLTGRRASGDGLSQLTFADT
jgi:hypothetical protein